MQKRGQVHNLKLLNIPPPSRLDPTFIDTLYDILHNKQSSSLEERFLGSIDINLARKLEIYLGKVAKLYQSQGFKSPAIDDRTRLLGAYIIYAYDYEDQNRGKPTPLAKYSKRCEAMKTRRYIAINRIKRRIKKDIHRKIKRTSIILSVINNLLSSEAQLIGKIIAYYKV